MEKTRTAGGGTCRRKGICASCLIGVLAFVLGGPALAARNLEPSRVDSRYFADASGRTFVPVGCNICFPRMYVKGSPGSRAECEERFFGWLRKFAANGGNYTRLWLGHPFFEIMPDKAGEYDSAAESTLRKTVALCEELGIKLKLTLESFRTVHPAGKEGKGMYAAFFNRPLYAPYAKDMHEFLHSEECARIYLGKARRLKALGLGDSPAVACWELWNEINSIGPWRGEVGPWSDRMLAELRAMFPRQMTVQNLGSFGSTLHFDYYDYLGRIPLNDFLQIHRYLDLGTALDVCHGPMDALAADAVRELLDRRGDIPAVVAEVGAVKPSHTGPSELYPKDKMGTLLHDEIFAPFFAGSAGSGQPWHWDHQYIDANGLWWHFARFAEAVKGIDPAAEHFRPFRSETRRLRIYGLRGRNTTLLWCRDKESTWESELARGVAPRPVSGEKIPFCKEFTCYLPWEDRWTGSVKDGVLPDFTRSVVVKAVKPAAGAECAETIVVPGEAASLLPAGRNLRLVWNDEFNGDRLDETKWSYRTNFWGRRAPWFAAPEDGAVEVKGGKVHLKIVKKPNGQFVSPQLQTGELMWDIAWDENRTGFFPLPKRGKPKFVHKYGYYECRFRLQRKAGWWSAFWMQTEQQGCTLDPAISGVEHDIMESFKPGEIIAHCFHANGYSRDYLGFRTPRVKDAFGKNAVVDVGTDDFHTIGMLWEPDGYTVYIDGKQHGPKVGAGKGEAVSHIPEFVLVTTECHPYRGKRMTAQPDENLRKVLDAAVEAGDDFVVDFVRVYDIAQ